MKVDISGKKAGMLTAIERLPTSKWLCLCDCGGERIVSTGHFNTGQIKSCGCHVINHGQGGKVKSREYASHGNMIARCHNPNNKRFKDYGAKGIYVCDEWRKSFVSFFKDMGRCPEGFQIDRIENDKGYYAENCQWISAKDNMANRGKTKIYTLFGAEYLSTVDAAHELNVSTNTIIHWCGLRRKNGVDEYYKAKEGCSWIFRTQQILLDKGLIAI